MKHNQKVKLCGWIRYIRAGKKIIFFNLDGCLIGEKNPILRNLQLVLEKDNNKENFEKGKELKIGTAIMAEGQLIKLQTEKKESWELKVSTIEIISLPEDGYPFQPKKHSFEFLRTHSDLRSRTRYFQALQNVRNTLFFALHEYFQNNFFQWLSAPTITKNDCEGGGESFVVAMGEKFFGHKALLTVSGQFHAEAYAQSFHRVYTFGPTFRADKSNTRFHGAEFWMLEPEMAFGKTKEMIQLIKEMLFFVADKLKKQSYSDLIFLGQKNQIDLILRLQSMSEQNVPVISYTEALEILQKEMHTNKKWGEDFTKEEEIFLCNQFDKPIFIVDYPKKLKAFYMKLNADNKTVKAFDMILPEIGELIGGSERESDYEKIKKNAKEKEIDLKTINWYLNLRKKGYGGSSGFGLGFDRLLMYTTGVENIRDSIPFFVGTKSLKW